jgi:DNA helicase HerA-like ATPase
MEDSMKSQPFSVYGLEAGFIVGETNPLEFTFVSSREMLPPRLEYLIVPGVEERTALSAGTQAQPERVDVLAQVIEVGIDSAVLSERLTYDEAVAILRGAYAPPPKMYGRARVIGYLAGQTVRTPRCAASPGSAVYVASDAFLQRFFSLEINAGIDLGTLINRPEVPVLLDPNGLRRHLAIIAQTGAGKSYLAGKLFESLLQLGATIFVFDPNSDYVQLRRAAGAGQEKQPYDAAEKTLFADDIEIYRIPGIQGRRFPDAIIGPTRDFTVRFSDLDADEICELVGISERSTNLRGSVNRACAQLRQRNNDYRPAELIAELQGLNKKRPSDADENSAEDNPLGQEDRQVAYKAARYIERLKHIAVWGYQDVAIEPLLAPQHLTVFDLAGADKMVAAYAAERTLREIWQRALRGQLDHPIFIVLEEAHNLIPASGNTRASRIINTVAAEGRKFRVFLTLITQRPSKVSPDTLSQCGSQIIMQLTNPDDQRAVQKASEAISAELLADLPGLNKGEAIVLGQLTRIPVMLSVSARASAEGGSDVDVVEELRKAVQAKSTQRAAQEMRGRGAVARQREEW